ncbi:MAG: 3-keto-5-aminohexanoate cleavage protein [Alphaproteobacteria bacterium]
MTAPDGSQQPGLIITAAPNGARKVKSDHTAIPITLEEIVAEAKAVQAAGAAILHLHVRDEHEAHSLDVDTYRRTIDAIRDALGDGLIIQATTEAVGRYTVDEQVDLVHRLKPEGASLAFRELTRDGNGKLADLMRFAADEGIFLQHILYDPSDIERFAAMLAEQPDADRFRPLNVLYVLGRYTGGVSAPPDLLPYLAAAEETGLSPEHWCMCAFGAKEGAIAIMAATLGGHVRVGFENNLLLADGGTAPSNAALIDQVVRGAELIARPVLSAVEAREFLT